ncbi:MAG: hypothetical protein ACR2KJ_00705 [Jatrophihabitans sp.]
MVSSMGIRRAVGAFVGLVVVAGALVACGDASTPLTKREKQVQSNDTNVSMKNCGSQCSGEIDGAKYSMKLPKKWNGTLLLYSHGYRFAQPAPPDFGPVSTSAQVTSTDSDGSGSDPLSQKLLSDGYALAGSSYKSNGWAVADGVKAGEDLHAKFLKLVGAPKRTYVWGDSLGGLITELLNEKHPDWVDGAAPMCGAVAGPDYNFDLALDVAYAVKTLIYPELTLTGYSSAQDASDNWTKAAAAVAKAAGDTAGGGTAKIIFIGALADVATQTQTFDGADIASQVKARVEAILTALAFGTSGRYELEQRLSGNPSDNTKTDYSKRVDSAESGLVAFAGGDPAALEAKLAAGIRVSADEDARNRFEALGDTTGKIAVPTLTMHTEADPLVIVQNERVLADRAAKSGAAGNLVQLYIKAPSTYTESEGAPYGAGHCNFNDEQREGLITTLDGWVRNGVYPVPNGVGKAFGAGLDPTYTPGAWPGGGDA